MRRRFALPFGAVALTLTATFLSASAASAEGPGKEQLLSSWTQADAGSQSAWLAARNDQGQYAEHGFDWSTDYCSYSPDNPGGFPFSNACARHDFGYRNHKAAGTFEANKARLDNAFHEDMKRVCAGYSAEQRTSCEKTAWYYYQAVSWLGVAKTQGAATPQAAV
ncbi:phospholipase [Streptomyces solicathayae]|uniref:Phospholipase n=1 Tax=Streptomyces solicathayae TaxID=3081768 RepID=A0ABZ0LWN8_9ACTN|nr:phospholipase [Streptomyces sp. HUAS YS2]WOX23750.1 phospholipase [Streptomyces sp. HUAS YS2]